MGRSMSPFQPPGSLRAQLWLLWLFIVLVTAALAAVLISLYRRGSAAEVETGRRATVAACHTIQSLLAANFAADAPPSPAHGDVLTVLLSDSLDDATGVEGGVWARGVGFLAYAYPTHEGALPKLDVPAAEMPWIVGLSEKALAGTTVQDVRQGTREAVILAACPLKADPVRLAAWTMTRVRSTAADAHNRLVWGLGLLLAFVLLSGGWLAYALSRWSRGVAALEHALAHHPLEDLPRLERSSQPDIGRIINALNSFTVRLKGARKHSRELGRKLAHADRLAALGRAAAGVVHEIRNPIGAMRLKAENALAESPDRQRSALKTILGQIDRLERLCESLLAASRPLSLEVRDVEVTDWLDARLRAIRERPDAALVRVHGRSEVKEARFDPSLLGRALDNLLLNALQHTPPGGRIEAAVLRKGEMLSLTVADTGTGIPDSVREHLFEPFVSGRGGGIGLGLAIAREIAEAHGGTIRSISSCQGAMFELELPWRAS